jgi:hypothetical protein
LSVDGGRAFGAELGAGRVLSAAGGALARKRRSELIDDGSRRNVAGLLMSLTMLIETQNGFDYTGADCCTWMSEAGFRETRVEQLTGSESMVVGIK